ncbi:hypothetical protein [Marinobacter shengliensis]
MSVQEVDMGSHRVIPMAALPGAVLRITPDGRIEDLNQSADELDACLEPGMALLDCLSGPSRSTLQSQLDAAGTIPEEVCELEARIGKRLYRMTFARSTCPDGTRFVQLVDITDYRRLSERIAVNEQRFRSLFS